MWWRLAAGGVRLGPAGRLCQAPGRLCQMRAASVAPFGLRVKRGVPGAGAATTEFRRAKTSLGAYLESCGATWGDAFAGHEVVVSADRRAFTWGVDLSAERLAGLRRGESLESSPFALGPRSRGRFQFFPKGDMECKDEDMCSLWLLSDSNDHGRVRLRVGSVERDGGASEFCKLADVLPGQGSVLQLEAHLPESTADTDAASQPRDGVVQSLQLTGLQLAEWRIFQARTVLGTASGDGAPQFISSPPFRFHHVLLGDMYLEVLPGTTSELCTLFFRCRVPTMKLKVEISVGDVFSNSLVAVGKNTLEDDLTAGIFLQVNLDAPGVVDADGTLVVRCALEEVVSIPPQLRDMMPRLDERAHWPKRL